ncbi:MAG: DUF4386 domain-containing protein [Gemmatimonadaceae bacterium]
MTRRTNARIAGFTFLFYIAVAFPALVLFGRATSAEETAAKLAGIASHATDVRITIVLSLLSGFSALVLAVTLYAITRDQDRDLAMLALTCRVGEGVVIGAFIPATVGVLWLATASGANAPDGVAAQAVGAFVLRVGDWNGTVAAAFFAAGSTLFSWLLLRGRMIPTPLAWLGVVGSVLLVVGLPLQLAGFFRGPAFGLMWLPMAVFELVLGPWLIIKGVATPATR